MVSRRHSRYRIKSLIDLLERVVSENELSRHKTQCPDRTGYRLSTKATIRPGNPKLAEARKRAVQGNKSSAARYAANVLPVIREIQASGVKSLRGEARSVGGARCCDSAWWRMCKWQPSSSVRVATMKARSGGR